MGPGPLGRLGSPHPRPARPLSGKPEGRVRKQKGTLNPVSHVLSRSREGMARWEVSFVWEGKCVGERRHWKLRPKTTAPHSAQRPAAAGWWPWCVGSGVGPGGRWP